MYENIFNQISLKFQSLTVYARSGAVVGMNYPELSEGKYRIVETSLQAGTPVQFTGRFFETIKGEICFQVRFGYNLSSYGYLFEDQFSYFTNDQNPVEAEKVNSIIKELVANNQQILENNLFCARIFEICRDRGIVLPVSLRKDLYILQTRLLLRNEKIKTSGYLQDYTESVSPNLSIYNDKLISFMQNPGVGIVISGTVAIVVSVVLMAGSFAGAYLLFKNLHSESKVDFTYSNDLTAKLIKFLPRDTYNQLMSENAANAKLAQKAIDQASGKGTFNTIKYLAVGYLGFFLIDKFFIKK